MATTQIDLTPYAEIMKPATDLGIPAKVIAVGLLNSPRLADHVAGVVAAVGGVTADKPDLATADTERPDPDEIDEREYWDDGGVPEPNSGG